MQDNRSIVITLKIDGGEKNEANTANQTNTSQTKNSTDKDSTAKVIAIWAAKELAETAAREAISWGEYFWNRELVLNDDYIGQRNKNLALTQINRGIGVVSSVASSTIQGAVAGGWIGAIVGFAIGTATQAANIVRSNLQGQLQQDIQIAQMDAQLNFTRSRAGWSTQAASIGEDL